ncbi:putative homeobox protein SMOX-4 [Schistosoma mansoni]|uniref:Putative homeobox protein SMOX-4 n=1 Tax=Schistosoma mansoni TaxID=6183 RepID=G4VIE3_SCHMA|nr:putative homeobox protein SMOX-4 [Schistosoma mansoni]|eukprot:XP_018651800.1 putative homeobox protein SMOX-4 [Schistosoma mansoni]
MLSCKLNSFVYPLKELNNLYNPMLITFIQFKRFIS